MSIWTRITEALAALAAGESLSAVFEKLTTPPERSVGFAIAVIALGAKMAKADGEVTRDEVRAFREVFQIAAQDEAAAARVFNLARQDVAGFQSYARAIQKLFADDPTPLHHVMEGLFHIAMANGQYHPKEEAFLKEVASIFGLTERCFRIIKGQFVDDGSLDPYDVLGLDPTASFDDARLAWRRAVREFHPDKLMASGLPEEALKIAQDRMARINWAWDEISQGRAA